MTKLLWLRAQGGEGRIEGTEVEKSRAGERSQITSGRQRLRKPCNRQLMPMTRMGSTRQRGSKSAVDVESWILAGRDWRSLEGTRTGANQALLHSGGDQGVQQPQKGW
jgi:hypothetical protein